MLLGSWQDFTFSVIFLDSFPAFLCSLRESYFFDKKQEILWRKWWLASCYKWMNNSSKSDNVLANDTTPISGNIWNNKQKNIEFFMISDPPRNSKLYPIHTSKDYSWSSKSCLLLSSRNDQQKQTYLKKTYCEICRGSSICLILMSRSWTSWLELGNTLTLNVLISFGCGHAGHCHRPTVGKSFF